MSSPYDPLHMSGAGDGPGKGPGRKQSYGRGSENKYRDCSPDSGASSGRSSSGGSGTSSPLSRSRSPTLRTSYFGKISPKTSSVGPVVAASQAPPSPSTVKKLLRIRNMAKTSGSGSGSITTIPTQPTDINTDWAKLVINQHRMKHMQPPLDDSAEIMNFQVEDCKKSSSDLSSTCRMTVRLACGGEEVEYFFIAKLLPADDPCRVYVFEANVFEKEISIYFELLPCMRQSCLGSDLSQLISSNIPQCIYGSNNMDGAGVLVFECAQEQGFLHPVDPEGLSLAQVLCVVTFMAKFHALGSALISRSPKSVKLRHPYLRENVYSSPMMIEGAKKMFETYTQFLGSVSEEGVKLADIFSRHCSGDDGAKEMYSCLRRQVDSPFNTIIHGELWEKNMLFRDGEDVKCQAQLQCVILDWKNAKIASATKDLAFLLLSSTTNQLRKESLELILHHYFSTFCNTLRELNPEQLDGPGNTFEEFFADYKVSTKGAFMQSVCVLIQEMQHIEYQLQQDNLNTNSEQLAETLRIYERRALNMMNDSVLNETHFVSLT